MQIAHFIYDDLGNPWCGGGGAYRAFEINNRLAKNHQVKVYTGNFPNARNQKINGVEYIRLGLGWNYLTSVLTYAVLVNIVCGFSRATLVVNDVFVFVPVFSFILRRKQVTILHHVLEKQYLKTYPFAGYLLWFLETLILKFSDNIVFVSNGVQRKVGKITKKNKLFLTVLIRAY